MIKIKVLFCLALVLSGGLLGCSKTPPKSIVIRTVPIGTWAKKLKTPWTETSVVLYQATGEVVQLDAKKAVYTVWSIKNPAHAGKEFDVPMIAFIDSKTGNAWVGGMDALAIETNEFINNDHTVSTNYLVYTNLFFESDSQILKGGSRLFDGTFDCCESVLKKALSTEGLDSVIERFDKSTDGAWPCSGADWMTTFGDDFSEGFFNSGNLGSQTTQIQRVEIADGKLRLDFSSLKYRTTGSVWLDLNTLKVLKSVEHK